MTPIEFWDKYIAHYGEEEHNPMTIERGDKLADEINRRIKASKAKKAKVKKVNGNN